MYIDNKSKQISTFYENSQKFYESVKFEKEQVLKKNLDRREMFQVKND